MVDYSKAAISIILEDFKRWSKFFKIFFSIFTICYFGYVIVMESGNLYVNMILIAMYIFYTIFELVTAKKEIKKVKKRVKKTYKWLKLVIKAFTLSSMLYGIYVASNKIDGITIILATLMIILWVLQVLLEIIIHVMEPRVKLVMAGVLMDAKPVVSAINFFKKENIVIDYSEYESELEKLEKRVELTRPKKEKKKFGLFRKKKNKELE